MKKTLALFILILFLVSLVPVGFAKKKTDPTATSTVVTSVKAQEQKEARVMSIQERKAQISAQFGERRAANIEKLKELDPAKLRRIQALNNVRLEKIAGLNKIQINKIAKLSRARQKELAGLNKSDIEKVLAKIKVKTVNKAADLRLRVLTKVRLEVAKNNFIKAKNRYNNAKAAYLSAKAKYLAAKDSGDQEAAIEHAKEVLLKSAEAIIGHLERIKAKIDESENIDEEKVQDLIERIDAKIAELEAIKEKIEAATTADEIREAARELNIKWKNTKQKARAFAERVVTARVQGVVNQAEVLEKKLDHALAKMEEKGIEVNVDAELEEFSSLVADAKEKFKQGQEKLEQAREEEDKDLIKSLVDEAKSLIDESRDLLKEAHNKLKEILTKIREAGQELEIDETSEVEVEEETEEVEEESGGDNNA